MLHREGAQVEVQVAENHVVVKFKLAEEEGKKLPMSKNNRPSWDLDMFIKLGFKYVIADTDISDKIPFSEKELMEYEGVSPQFMVGAAK